MKYNVYAVRDAYIGFMTPVIEQNDAVAKRNFEHAVAQTDSLMHSHRQDYDLYRIGEFDAESGFLTPLVPPVVVMAATSVEV